MCLRNVILIFSTINALVTFVNCARILCIGPIPSYSHQIVYRPIWEALAKKGHDLVVLTTDPWETQNLTNIKQIDLHFTYKFFHEDLKATQKTVNLTTNVFGGFREMQRILDILMDKELEFPPVKKLLTDKNEHFDLVIVEYMFPTMFAFSNHFNCPYVGIASMDVPATTHSLFGNPTHPILYPDFLLPYDSSIDMTFKERFQNTITTFFINVFAWFNGYSATEPTVEKHFGKNLPPIEEIRKNVSLILININPILNKRPLGPATIAFGGGVHVQPPKPLPKDLSEFLDGARNGLIYFSLGSNVNEYNVNPEMRQIFLNVFQKLPYRVLWKFNVDIPNLPKNVKMVKWVPQQDVLRHPNVKLFITQGGLQSMEEAIFMNIPLVIVPFFADQMSNADKMTRRGVGLVVNKDELNENHLRETIEEVINNGKYKSKMIEIAELSKDQPGSNIDKAVWWIEYVLRHNGAKHLRDEVAMELPWYHYYLLDIFAVLFAIFATVIYVIRLIFKLILKKICSSKGKLKKN